MTKATDTGWEEMRADIIHRVVNEVRSAPEGTFVDVETIIDATLQAAGVKELVEESERRLARNAMAREAGIKQGMWWAAEVAASYRGKFYSGPAGRAIEQMIYKALREVYPDAAAPPNERKPNVSDAALSDNGEG